jgi:hypothetical protein
MGLMLNDLRPGVLASTLQRYTLMGAVVTVLVTGCSRSGNDIQVYQIPKRSTLESSSGPVSTPTDRMLAAVVPLGTQAWFLKVAGPEQQVAQVAEGFRGWVESLKPEGEPGSETLGWTLPDGWTETPGDGMRRATFVAASAPSLDIALTVLPLGQADRTAYMLANVNRWRGQMQLPPVDPIELAETIAQLDIGRLSVTLVDLKGRLVNAGGMSAPFAGAGQRSGLPSSPAGGGSQDLPAGHPPIDAIGTTGLGPVEGGESAPSTLTYKVPDGWREGQKLSMRKAAYLVQQDGRQVEITIIDLPTGAADILANVNRWRDQVGLRPLSESELSTHAEAVEIDGHQSTFVELVGTDAAGSPTTILAVITPSSGDIQGRIWFIKLMGDAQLAESQRQKFLEFAKSVKF